MKFYPFKVSAMLNWGGGGTTRFEVVLPQELVVVAILKGAQKVSTL